MNIYNYVYTYKIVIDVISLCRQTLSKDMYNCSGKIAVASFSLKSASEKL